MLSKLSSFMYPEKLLTERLYRVFRSRYFFSPFHLKALSATKQNRAYVIQNVEKEQGPWWSKSNDITDIIQEQQ